MATTLEVPQHSTRFDFLDRYRRITSSGQFVPEIDGLRFLAIFSVYIFHLSTDIGHHSSPEYSHTWASNWLYLATKVLDVGVPLFFVISGFILSLPFASAQLNHKKPVSLRKYFLRRLTRLEPPYILCLLAIFFLKIATAKGTAIALLPNLVASIFYIHNPVFLNPSVINPVAWSLEIEVQFYILAPLMAMVYAIGRPSIRRSVLVSLVALACVLSKIVSSHAPLNLSLLAHAQYFLAGFVLTELYLSGWCKRGNDWRWDLVFLGSWVSMIVLLVRARGIWTAPSWLPWLLLLLCIAAFRGAAVNRFFTTRSITIIGGMCYTIYLLHGYTISVLGNVTEHLGAGSSFPLRLLIQFLLISPLMLVISAVYFRLVERPCMRPDWPRRLRTAFSGMYSRPRTVQAEL